MRVADWSSLAALLPSFTGFRRARPASSESHGSRNRVTTSGFRTDEHGTDRSGAPRSLPNQLISPIKLNALTRIPCRRSQIYRVVPSFTEFYRVSSHKTAGRRMKEEFYRVLLGFTKFYSVLPSFLEFSLVLLGFTLFQLVLQGFTRYH